MAMAFKRTLFGYSKPEVNKRLRELDARITALEMDLKREQEKVAEFRNRVARTEEKEEFINQALVDAKSLSKRIIEEAQMKADTITMEIENDARSRLTEFEVSMQQLSGIEAKIISQEHQLREELKAVLTRYADMIDNMDTTQFHALQTSLDEQFDLVEEKVQKSKTMIVFPKLDKTTPKISTQPVDDTPVYTFNMN